MVGTFDSEYKLKRRTKRKCRRDKVHLGGAELIYGHKRMMDLPDRGWISARRRE